MSTTKTTRVRFASAPYLRIEADMRARIRSGQWLPGALVSSRRDLARQYGVELSTIQRAINRLLEDRTLEARAGVGTFVASVESRPRLKPMPLGTLGVLGGDFTVSFDGRIADSLERHFSRAGGAIHLFEYDSARCRRPIAEALRAAVEQDCAALVVIGGDGNELEAALASTPNLPEVTILIVENRLSKPYCCVSYDNRDAGFQAAQHLIDRGCQDVLFVPTYDKGLSWVDERLAGIRDAFACNGYPPERVRVSHEGQFEPPLINRCVQAGLQAVEEDFVRGLPSGVIAVNDQVGQAIVVEAAKRGFHAGIHYALIGFDDDPRFRTLQISTLRQPLEEMGREASRLVCQMLAGETGVGMISLKCHLVARMSSCGVMSTYSE